MEHFGLPWGVVLHLWAPRVRPKTTQDVQRAPRGDFPGHLFIFTAPILTIKLHFLRKIDTCWYYFSGSFFFGFSVVLGHIWTLKSKQKQRRVARKQGAAKSEKESPRDYVCSILEFLLEHVGRCSAGVRMFFGGFVWLAILEGSGDGKRGQAEPSGGRVGP